MSSNLFQTIKILVHSAKLRVFFDQRSNIFAYVKYLCKKKLLTMKLKKRLKVIDFIDFIEFLKLAARSISLILQLT